MCKCAVCTESREIDEMIDSKDVEALSKKVRDLKSRLSHAEEDRDVNQAVMKGEWPDSIGILERCLKRAREKNERT